LVQKGGPAKKAENQKEKVAKTNVPNRADNHDIREFSARVLASGDQNSPQRPDQVTENR